MLGILSLCEENRELYSTTWMMQFVADQIKYILDNDVASSTDNEDSSDEEEGEIEEVGATDDKGSVESEELDEEENCDSPLNEVDPVRFSRDLLYTQATY